jgi:hypothetical protein
MTTDRADVSEPRTPEVVIDGVRYVPAATAAPGVPDVLRALALQYHTPETLEEYGTSDLRIVVGDSFDSNEGETFDEFAARLAQATR